MPYDKILIINLGGIGDLILSTAALKPLRERYKNSRIDLLAVNRAVEFMRSYNIFDNIYTYNPGSLTSFLKLLLSLRKNRYDLAMNMRTIVTRKSALKIMSVIKIINPVTSAGRDTDGLGWFFDYKVPETYIGKKHEFEYDIDLVKLFDVKVDKIDLSISLNQADIEYSGALLKEAGIPDDAFLVGMNPGGGVQSRRWNAENYIELAKLILKDTGCRIAVTGSSGESALCRRIAEGTGSERIYDFSGKTTVNQMAAIIKRFKIYISNDTGPMHICIFTGTPGVFIFGPGQPARYANYKDTDKYEILFKQPACGPCELPVCEKMTCLEAYSANDVYSAFLRLKDKFYA
jgi:heptosyltransferase II